MTNIEKYLHQHFANQDEDIPDVTPSSSARPTLSDSRTDALQEPFAKVNTVADNSPASTAGLKAGDEIRTFGYVNRSNHENLKKVAECVQGNEGVRLAVCETTSVLKLTHE